MLVKYEIFQFYIHPNSNKNKNVDIWPLKQGILEGRREIFFNILVGGGISKEREIVVKMICQRFHDTIKSLSHSEDQQQIKIFI